MVFQKDDNNMLLPTNIPSPLPTSWGYVQEQNAKLVEFRKIMGALYSEGTVCFVLWG